VRRDRGERVLLWPGKGTELWVTGADPELQQLVLRVREPLRKFTEQRWDAKHGVFRTVVRKTDPALRRFLVGMDESHLFVSQLTTAARTVAEAHEGIPPRVLEERPETARQVEWFFVPLTDEERQLLAKSSHRFFLRNAQI